MSKRLGFLVVGAVILAACGGGVGIDDVIDGEDVFATPSTNEDGSFDIGAGEAGAVTVTADPSQAWVEVDGERFVYEAIDTVHYECVISDERVTMNFQRNDGHSFLIQGSPLEGGEWLLNLTFTTADHDNISYGGTLPGDGSLGLDDEQLSYEGPIDRVEDRDVLNPVIVDAQMAVNCSLPGDQPTAVIGGTEYVVSMADAGSVSCDVSNEMINVEINRLVSDGTNIFIQVQAQDGGWAGLVSVTTPEGNFHAKGATESVDLSVDGSSVSYEGTFEGDNGDVEGSLSVTCP